MAKIQLSEAQIAALAEHLGVEPAELTQATADANGMIEADPATDRLSRADVQRLWAQGKHREIEKARAEGRISAEPASSRDRVLRRRGDYNYKDAS